MVTQTVHWFAELRCISPTGYFAIFIYFLLTGNVKITTFLRNVMTCFTFQFKWNIIHSDGVLDQNLSFNYFTRGRFCYQWRETWNLMLCFQEDFLFTLFLIVVGFWIFLYFTMCNITRLNNFISFELMKLKTTYETLISNNPKKCLR